MAWPIELCNVSKRFGSRAVLNDVSFRVQAGETVALIGPSGGGKSTLLRCLNGLTTFDGGEIRIGPHQLAANQANANTVAQVRASFGMIFQDYQLFPHLSVLANVMEAPVRVLRTSHDEARAHAEALLERVGMMSHAHAYPGQLSGGQKQRVAIARALAMRPQGLLCDEITAALDPELKGEVLDVLRGLKEDGLTIVLVTHEMGFTRHSADRVVVLCDGQVLEMGPPAEVMGSPRTERLAQFLRRVLV